MKELEYVRREIRNNGYLSTLQIVLRLTKHKSNINRDEIDLILSTISCKDIHKIAYTNSYVSALKLKCLYYYNPTNKKTSRRKKPNTKKKNQGITG